MAGSNFSEMERMKKSDAKGVYTFLVLKAMEAQRIEEERERAKSEAQLE